MSVRAAAVFASLLVLSPGANAVAQSPIAADTAVIGTIAINVGASEILRSRPGVGTIILGNPEVADASVINSTTIAITGKLPGTTNLILLDLSGNEMLRTMLQIGFRQTQVVVFGGAKSQSYSCAPGCVTAPSAAPTVNAAPVGSTPTEIQ